jgi:cell division transport system permease protein
MNIWTSFRRVLASGAKDFMRGGVVSAANVTVMTVTLVIIGSLIFLSALLQSTLTAIQDKVDVNVYFVTSATEDQITQVADQLRSLPQVQRVTYTSREQALADFRERHANDQLTLQALDELGDNPLDASLAIKAKDPSEYQAIVDFLSNNSALGSGNTTDSSLVDSINYYQNKTVIDRLTAAIRATEQAGVAIVVLFALASAIIAIATIRLAIYSARDEIAVMRLVGASDNYIRGPFVVEGIIAGIAASLISLLLFYPATWYAGDALQEWLGGFNLFTYYLTHFPLIFGILLASGIVLGGIASWLAVRRYLKI